MSRILLASALAALAASSLPIALTAAEPEGLPAASEPRPMLFAQPSTKTLANGLQVIVVDRPGLPLVTAGLILKRGSEADPKSLPGLAQFTGELLMRGTAKRAATQLAQDLEELGASIAIEAGWDETTAVLTTLANQSDASLSLLAEVVRQPAFAADEIERYRKEAIDELTVTLEQPGQLARVVAAIAILGDTPYGHSASGTLKSLAAIQRDNITRFHSIQYTPASAALILSGDLRAADGFALAEKWFGDWQSTAKDDPKTGDKATAPEAPKGAPQAILVDQPDAGQAAVYIGRATAPRKDEHYAVSQVTNGVLGGGYSARLNREVRIKRGLSYGCGSKLYAYRAAGLFGASAQTKNESAADVVRVIREELAKLGRDAIPSDEFGARKLVLTGSFERALETNEGYVNRIADFFVHDEPVDGFARTLATLNAVTPADAQAYAGKTLLPEESSVIVVARAAACEAGLRKLFPNLRVIPRDQLDLDSAKLTAETPAKETKR